MRYVPDMARESLPPYVPARGDSRGENVGSLFAANGSLLPADPMMPDPMTPGGIKYHSVGGRHGVMEPEQGIGENPCGT